MHLGAINSYLLIGGGQLLFDVASELNKNGCRFLVVTNGPQAATSISPAPGRLGFFKESLQLIGVQCHVSDNINDDDSINGFIGDQTLGLSISSRWIFQSAFIEKFNGRLVNMHGAALPTNRGGGGHSWAIMNNQRRGGCTIHLVERTVDTGDILALIDYFYPASCRTPSDRQAFADERNTAFVIGFINDVAAEKDFARVDQPHRLSTYWPRLNTDVHGFVDWSWSLEEIVSFTLAFDDPYKGASTFLKGKRVYLKNCLDNYEDGPFHPFQTGIVYRKSFDGLFIAVREGTLIVQQLLDDQTTSVVGHVAVGDRLHTPRDVLDAARVFRASYNA